MCPGRTGQVANERLFYFPGERVRLRELTFIVRRYESQYVLVPQHDRLVYLGLSEPGALFSRGEYFYCDVLTPPSASPDLPKAALPNDVD